MDDAKILEMAESRFLNKMGRTVIAVLVDGEPRYDWDVTLVDGDCEWFGTLWFTSQRTAMKAARILAKHYNAPLFTEGW